MLGGGEYYVTSFDPNNHFEDNILRIEKYDAGKIWTAVLYDADNEGYPYVKRFLMDATKKHQNFLGENPNSQLLLVTDQPYPRIRVVFGEADSHREPMELELEEFVGVKGFKAKGKRLTTWHIDRIEELEPTRQPEPEEEDLSQGEPESTEEDLSQEEPANTEEAPRAEEKSPQFKYNPQTGELSLFGDDDM